jgi:hypothetical protein
MARPPENLADALELPPAVKRHLDWPGPDLRRVGDRDSSSVAYGFLPPRLFAELRRRFLALEAVTRSLRVTRTE